MAWPAWVNQTDERRAQAHALGLKNRTHGHSGVSQSRTYTTWRAMKQRCDNPADDCYHMYGGRGISYDPAWLTFAAFLADMGDRPEGMTLDRIDPDRGYSKDNCRWADAKTQRANRRKADR